MFKTMDTLLQTLREAPPSALLDMALALAQQLQPGQIASATASIQHALGGAGRKRAHGASAALAADGPAAPAGAEPAPGAAHKRARDASRADVAAPGVASEAPAASPVPTNVRPKKAKKASKYNPADFRYRQVALSVAYLGHEYKGLAAFTEAHLETETSRTVEGALFRALEKAKLLPDGGRAAARYTRSGRTDAGVSAAGQLLSLRLRSKAKKGQPLPELEDEFDYARVLNAILPPDVQVMSWCPVDKTFNARFHAGYRVYRYYFVRRALNVAAMAEAGHAMVGTHDFRNICRPYPDKAVRYTRTVLSLRILPTAAVGSESPGAQAWGGASAAASTAGCTEPDLATRHEIWYIEVVGRAFLWHQVRAMAAVLFLVGKGLEPASSVRRLLDIESTPGRPAYPLAPHANLCLYHCQYQELPLVASPAAVAKAISALEQQWGEARIRAAMLGDMLTWLWRTPVYPYGAQNPAYGTPAGLDCTASPDTPLPAEASDAVSASSPDYAHVRHAVSAADPKIGTQHVPVHALAGTTSALAQVDALRSAAATAGSSPARSFRSMAEQPAHTRPSKADISTMAAHAVPRDYTGYVPIELPDENLGTELRLSDKRWLPLAHPDHHTAAPLAADQAIPDDVAMEWIEYSSMSSSESEGAGSVCGDED